MFRAWTPSGVLAQWPEFRGPTGQGTASGAWLPTRWDRETNIAWRRELPGEGWSSPVLVGERIYLTAALRGARQGDYLLEALCVDAATGALLWQRAVFEENGDVAPGIHQKNSHASPTPLVDGGHLFVHYGHQGTACLDLDGNIRWTSREVQYHPVHGNGGSPVLCGDVLIFTADGANDPRVVGLSREAGTILWQHRRDTDAEKCFSFCTPLLISHDGKDQVIVPGSNVVSSLDPATGEEIWRVSYEGYSVVPRPVYGNRRVYVCTGYDEPKLLAIRVDGTGDVTESHVEWELKRSVPLTPSPLLDGDHLYLVSDRGIVSCVDARDGTILWQERIPGNYSASPILAAGKIYVQNEDGTGVVLAAGRRFEKLAENRLGERSLASYAVSERAIFLRTEKAIYRIEDLVSRAERPASESAAGGR